MRVLISVFVVSVKRLGGAGARRGNNRQGLVEQSSDEDYVDDVRRLFFESSSRNRHHAQS
jgi:hypothetical protein